ncbi:MAG: alpha amylase C-terminal domain-containing protein [Acidobacteria bacterium]|nr:alpha amylase C-terminal domain-containing protein [Acidobacteriota bacterium]
MPASQQHITSSTLMGATLVDGGATFRVWAPQANKVYISGDFNGWQQDDASLLERNDDQRWTGFIPGAQDGHKYKFWIEGHGTSGYKRDPYARELTNAWPNPDCILRSAGTFPWQDWSWKTPEFRDLIVYQFHIGTYFGPNRESRVAKFLDVLDRVEYLADLGVNAIAPLPIVEYSTPRSMGYNGSDLFSPEMDYQVADTELDRYIGLANRLLAQKGKSPLTRQVLATGINQLKALVDICHHYGLAVILDVVYNHASGDIKGQDESIYFFDRAAGTDPRHSLYFTDQDHTGPVFAFWKDDVKGFLIDNAKFFIDEYHVNGFRYDQVTVIDKQNVGSGWLFCQRLNSTVNFVDPEAINIAEYWGPEPAVVRPQNERGAGFHANWHDGLRRAIRGVINEASWGQGAGVNWQPVVDQLRAPGFPDAWRAVQYLESHDEVYRDRGHRVPSLAVGGGNTRTWYATSRARVATALILTAPGIPMLFMGQEFYEDKKWADDPPHHAGTLLYWDGLTHEKTMIDFHRFTRELNWLRRKHPALRGEGIATVSMENGPRVLVFQRWVEGVGRDVIVVASLSEFTHYGYQIPMPSPGLWVEVFNSDIYENWVNPAASGNGGSIQANGPSLNGLPASAFITVPANSVLVFARDMGD